MNFLRYTILPIVIIDHRMMKARLLSSLFAFLCGTFVQGKDAETADELWRSASPESQGFSSAKLEAMRVSLAAHKTKALLVIRNDTIVCEWYAPDSAASQKHGTASLAKAIVGGLSFAVAMSDGRIALDDPAAKFIPQWRNDPRKSRITLRQLGSHTSGIDDAEADGKPHGQLSGWKGDFWKRLAVPEDPFTIARDRVPLVFEPGEKMLYSNPGIALMTYCVTAALRDAPQKDIRSLLRERVMKPIGVPNAEWSVGYGQTFTVDDLALVPSWGGGSYTARAAARVGRLMLRGGDWNGQRILSSEAVRLVTSDAHTPGPCGMGWWSNNEGDCAKLPRDAFFGSGAGHEIVLVIPSLNVIVVRFGEALAGTEHTPKAFHEPYRQFLFEPLIDAITGNMAEGAPSSRAGVPPYPPSDIISGVVFHDDTARSLAPGSDIWPLTWAADGHQYTTFGDGGGFGGTDHDGRVSLGIARIEGEKDHYTGLNIAGGKNAPHPAPFTGKSEGILAIGDTLYLWRNGEGSDRSAFEFVSLYRSTDHGATWNDLQVEFSRRNGDFIGADQGFFGVTFCQFGQGYTGARDEFIYLYASEIADRSHWNIQKPGRIILMRVEKDRLGDKSAYRFFAGLDAMKHPLWTADLTARRPVWEDAANGTHRIAVSYNAPLRRYLLSTMTVDRRGQVAIYDAPEPWGPWSTVLFQRDTSRWGSKVITFTFSNKWLSEDGKRFVLVHTKDDSWASIEGEFILAPVNSLSAQPPYAPSPAIQRVEFDFSTHRRLASGSDDWPTTWADDGHIYTAWGDGGGFGGSDSKGRVTLGVGRIEGEAVNYTGHNVWGGFASEHPAQFTGKSYGLLSIGGVLYMWRVPQPGPHLAQCQLAMSKDHGATWSLADWSFHYADQLTIPTFLNFGRDYEGARDGYVYSYFIQPTWGPGRSTSGNYGFDVHKPGCVYLARVPKEAIFDRERYEFFSGLEGNGAPSWSARLADKQPVFKDANGVGWNISVSFNPGLRRYLLCTEHGKTHAGKLGLFDAPEPWGPWSTVAYEEKWGEGHFEVSTFYWNFPTKWLSADGKHFTMVFTGKNTNDSWNTAAGHFVLRH